VQFFSDGGDELVRNSQGAHSPAFRCMFVQPMPTLPALDWTACGINRIVLHEVFKVVMRASNEDSDLAAAGALQLFRPSYCLLNIIVAV